MSTRSRKEEKTYLKHRINSKSVRCAFCDINSKSPQFIKSTKSFKVIRNIFAYSIWDGQRVVDHLLLLPKAHIDSLDQLKNNQTAEFVKLLSAYEKKGYNVYARAPNSPLKSVIHQHTHLIKTEGAAKWFILLLRKPFYIRLTR